MNYECKTFVFRHLAKMPANFLGGSREQLNDLLMDVGSMLDKPLMAALLRVLRITPVILPQSGYPSERAVCLCLAA